LEGGHTHEISGVVALDSRRVVSSSDRSLQIWDVETRERLGLFLLDARVEAMAVAQNGRIIIAGDASGRLHFFDLVESS
ncbi:MAG TPA: hypothetical protein VKM72_15870, partial [Thermoanaerobaculia bacterium]|nr:hypothetical protein [Thermoanaerobaculia bacterium]